MYERSEETRERIDYLRKLLDEEQERMSLLLEEKKELHRFYNPLMN
ncbi:hypothetical protein ACFSTH_11700 [Paenibacillus yanchengensis]|uniref:Uncharacterized protein n=1 Tax=Paenibacillus yanchengensis TaxID=2035833 RepID=A0ABW4YR48_9BACL